MEVTVDSRACGQGKTYHGIYNKIRHNIKEGKLTMIVAGSIALQEQYKQAFPEMTIINSETSTNSTTSEVLNAMIATKQLICITHQCFTLLPISHHRTQYELIIDEAIQNIVQQTPIVVKDNYVIINWEKHFELNESDAELVSQIRLENLDSAIPVNDTTFIKLTLVGSDEGSLLNSAYRQITNSNYDHYITLYDFMIMTQQSDSKRKSFGFYSLLNNEVFRAWNSIHIAAAAFDKTPMHALMKKIGYDFIITNKFKPHKVYIKFHFPITPDKWKWTNTKRKDNPELLKQMHEYINKTATGPVLALRNKDEVLKLDNEFALTHNVHGLNKPEYINSTNVSLESALVPPTMLKAFYKAYLLIGYNTNEANRLVDQFHVGYLFYQALGRCKLRDTNYNNEVINLFVPDQRIMNCIYEYFYHKKEDDEEIEDTAIYILYEIYDINLMTKEAQTDAERNKKCRDKKKETKIKKTPMTSAERKRKCIAKKKASNEITLNEIPLEITDINDEIQLQPNESSYELPVMSDYLKSVYQTAIEKRNNT